MLIYYFIATMAALCWAVASLISADVTRKIGGLAFNRLRLFFVSIMLIGCTFYLDTWNTINHEFLFTILFSGIIGIFLVTSAEISEATAQQSAAIVAIK